MVQFNCMLRRASFASQALAKLARRNMQLNCTIQDEQVWLADTEERVQVDLIRVKLPPARVR